MLVEFYKKSDRNGDAHSQLITELNSQSDKSLPIELNKSQAKDIFLEGVHQNASDMVQHLDANSSDR